MKRTILDHIIDRKRTLVNHYKSQTGMTAITRLAEQRGATRGFTARLAERSKHQPAIIAEIKKASPSKGIIRHDFNPEHIARSYEQGGATCLSVLTDVDFFHGHDDYLEQAKTACQLPVLRKDFIIDIWQIYQSRAIGADAILLICTLLNDTELRDMSQLAQELGLDYLLEVHNQEEMERAMAINAPLIGINNRNLTTFTTDIQTSVTLVSSIQHTADVTFISESGIDSHEQIIAQRKQGIHGFLIGESLMKQDDPGKALQQLLGKNE